MPGTLSATVIIAGDEETLGAYRARAGLLLAAEFDGRIRERHVPGRLEYRLESADGVPFPAFVTASSEFPELTVEFEWSDPALGTLGAATVRDGKLARQDGRTGTVAAGASGVQIHANEDGSLVLAVTCRRERDEWIGYALTSSQHAFFRVRGGRVLEATDGVEAAWAERWTLAGPRAAYTELDPREPLGGPLAAAVGRIADQFAEDWVWFAADAPAETAIERHRYELYGYRVMEANLRSEKLRGVMRKEPDGGYVFHSLDADGQGVAALVARHWLAGPR